MRGKCRWPQRPCRDSPSPAHTHAHLPPRPQTVRRHADPIPGALTTIAALRARGIKVGGNSGYNKPIMDAVFEESGKKGLKVDAMEW